MELAAALMRSNSRRVYSCGVKKAFVTWKEADRALKMMRRNDLVEDPQFLTVYRCCFCPYFHVGHGPIKQ